MIVQKTSKKGMINDLPKARKIIRIIIIILVILFIFELDHFFNLQLVEKYELDPMGFGNDDLSQKYLSEQISSIKSSTKKIEIMMIWTFIVIGFMSLISAVLKHIIIKSNTKNK